jgi:hypothetical protein
VEVLSSESFGEGVSGQSSDSNELPMTTRSTFSEEDFFLGVQRLDFKHIRKLAVLLPALYVGLFEFLRHQWLEPMPPS